VRQDGRGSSKIKRANSNECFAIFGVQDDVDELAEICSRLTFPKIKSTLLHGPIQSVLLKLWSVPQESKVKA
jgi:hypothetical protein